MAVSIKISFIKFKFSSLWFGLQMSLSESLIAKQNYTISLLKNETDLKKKGKNVQSIALK
ncbi:hypothetical protein L950_0221320 [Sphingobacterium sp. IITKGP-BTPF85]|nr:hypothetical protein L950_0221320 [Sphingobacterium sp. IITKGP-BTPF85]